MTCVEQHCIFRCMDKVFSAGIVSVYFNVIQVSVSKNAISVTTICQLKKPLFIPN